VQEVRFLHAGTYCTGMVDIKLVIAKVRMFSVGLFFWVQANCVFLLVPPPTNSLGDGGRLLRFLTGLLVD